MDLRPYLNLKKTDLYRAPEDGLPYIGVRSRGTLGDIDPLNKVPFKRARSRAKKGPL